MRSRRTAVFAAESAVRSVSEPLDELGSALKAASAQILQMAPEASDNSVNLALAGAYTMDGEREVYASVVGRLSGKVRSSASLARPKKHKRARRVWSFSKETTGCPRLS